MDADALQVRLPGCACVDCGCQRCGVRQRVPRHEGEGPNTLAKRAQEANEIFGNIDELMEMYEHGKRAAQGGAGDEDALDDATLEEGYSDEEAAAEMQLQRVS